MKCIKHPVSQDNFALQARPAHRLNILFLSGSLFRASEVARHRTSINRVWSFALPPRETRPFRHEPIEHANGIAESAMREKGRAMSINRVAISGNLTREPELRQTTSGMAVLGFGVAVNDRRKNQQTGEWEDVPNFIDCTMFGARAKSVSRFLSKGSKVAIEGKLRWSQWERDGQKRSKIEVVVDEIEFMSAGNGQAQANAAQQATMPAPAQPQQPAGAATAAPSMYDIYDEQSLPF